jgi:outer membrane receptor protein involved in Fe transport
VQREIPSPAGIVTIVEIDNAPAAYSYGAELQAQWRPSPQLTATAAAGMLRTRLTRTLSPTDPLIDREFQRAPHFSASIGATWNPVPTLQLAIQARHNSSYFSDDANTPSRRVTGATVADLNATFTSAGITLSLYARNLFDNFYLTYLYSPTARLATAGDPREIGGTIGVRF